MNTEEKLDLAKQGSGAWNAWAVPLRKKISHLDSGSHGLSKSEVAARQRDLREEGFVDFSGVIFDDDADFSNFVFPCGANFSDTKFEKKLLLEHAKIYGACLFVSVKFQGEVSMLGAKFFDHVAIEQSEFLSSVSMFEANFRTLNLRGSKFAKLLDFTLCKNDVDFSRALAPRNALDQNGLEEVKFLEGVSFHGANLSQLKFVKCKMPRADLERCNLRDCEFHEVDLEGAKLRGAKFNTNTKFERCELEDCEIDVQALESMDSYGGVSRGSRMRMRIHDDVATLRRQYSGYRANLHIVSLGVFAFPYAWFLMSRWGEATFGIGSSEQGIALGVALLRFIVNGGNAWQEGWFPHWSFLLFLGAFFFNVVRLILLWKTTELETQQVVTGLPALFSLTDTAMTFRFGGKSQFLLTWQKLLKASQVGLGLFVAVSIMNTMHFLSMSVPLGGENGATGQSQGVIEQRE